MAIAGSLGSTGRAHIHSLRVADGIGSPVADAAFLFLCFVPDGFLSLFFATDLPPHPGEAHSQCVGLNIITSNVAFAPGKNSHPFSSLILAIISFSLLKGLSFNV